MTAGFCGPEMVEFGYQGGVLCRWYGLHSLTFAWGAHVVRGVFNVSPRLSVNSPPEMAHEWYKCHQYLCITGSI